MTKIHAEHLTLKTIKQDLDKENIGYYITYAEAKDMFAGKYPELFFINRDTGEKITYTQVIE